MEPTEVPAHNAELTPSPETKIIRVNTPKLLISLIEQGALENISSLSDIPSGSVTALEGGVSSACYFLENNGKPLVVKFRTWGVAAEAEALRKWRGVEVSVPEVIKDGVVGLDIGTKLPVKYIILEGITDKKGGIAPTATDFVVRSNENLEQLGREMGR